jgi:hypothetical protein
VEEKLPSCGAICYTNVLYAILGGGEQFGRRELASRRRIWAAFSGG